MITRQDILAGGSFTVALCRLTTRKYVFNVVKDGDMLRVHGTQLGGRFHYIGLLYPESGHLARTSKTLKDRHIVTANVFRWVISMLWGYNEFPKSVHIQLLESELC